MAEVARGYRLLRIASETNGVGAMPTQSLARAVAGRGSVVPVTTTSGTKEDGFGRGKMLLSTKRLCLPRHPRLLAQLAALEYEERDSGNVRIAVPERSGHDDLCMALCLCAGTSDVGTSGPARVYAASGRLPPLVRRGAPGVPAWVQRRHRGAVLAPGTYR